jgi:hypothetical protein
LDSPTILDHLSEFFFRKEICLFKNDSECIIYKLRLGYSSCWRDIGLNCVEREKTGKVPNKMESPVASVS